MDTSSRHREVSLKTKNSLKTIAQSLTLNDLSTLSLPEIDAIIDQVAVVIPAGNVPGMVLNGLARLSGRKLPVDTIRRDINLLFKGVENALDKAVYTAVFAGPAAVIWGYQNLLKLVGRDPDLSFPQGTWQFYVDYALREDTARHANETHGFDSRLAQHGITLDPVDRLAAWALTAAHTLHQYPALLENEWRERVYIATLIALTVDYPQAARYTYLYRDWSRQRPYRRGSTADPNHTYPMHRRRLFDQFLAQATTDLPADLKRTWTDQIRELEASELPAYQEQMSIVAALDPGPYGETREPIPLAQAQIGLIHQDRYFLLPVCAAGTERPPDPATVRQQIAAILANPTGAEPLSLHELVRVRRAALPNLLTKLSAETRQQLEALRLTPIIINSDRQPHHLPLAEIRQAERGLGHHALTLFDTGRTIVFDQSHIFFDGGWGAALAEIMTAEALSWAVYLHKQPPPHPAPRQPYHLHCRFSAADRVRISEAPQVTAEISADSEGVNLKAIVALRKLFKQRNDLLQLTVNDLLVLYRAIHAATYKPNPLLRQTLLGLAARKPTRRAAEAALEALDRPERGSPAIVIPVDASQTRPRNRLFPLTLEVPLRELNLLDLHQQVIAALQAYRQAGSHQASRYAEFHRLQKTYLAALAGFGAVLSQTKERVLHGQSDSELTIKLLANMPPPLQRMLDKIPGNFDLLNDIIKGREVFSNLGLVAPGSTLSRFITAKDDNDHKTLAWGVLTDDQGVMHLSLRDFRPHVGLLTGCGHRKLAAELTRHYLEAYVTGLNGFIADLQRITITGRAKPR